MPDVVRYPAPSATEPALEELLAAAEAARLRGDYAAGADTARLAARVAAESGDIRGQGTALRAAASQLVRLTRIEEAIASAQESAVLLRAAGDDRGLCETLTLQALILSDAELVAEASDSLREAHAIAASLGDRGLMTWVLNRMGTVHSQLGDHVEAQRQLMLALDFVDTADTEAHFCVLNNLADNALRLVPSLREAGRAHEAEQVLAAALDSAAQGVAIAQSQAHPYREAICRGNQGLLLGLAGEQTAGLATLAEAERISGEHGYDSLAIDVTANRARLAALRGDYDDAVAGFLDALEHALANADTRIAIEVHRELSRLHERFGQFELALRHYRRFHDLERTADIEAAQTRVRVLVHHVELDNARLETELHRVRSAQLEDDKRQLEAQAVELGRRAYEDALTGVWNRRYADERLPVALARAAERRTPVTVAIADVDDFKMINDRFGHRVGDDVLRELGHLLRRQLRGGDFVCRVGGEEFLLTFEDTGLDEALGACSRLREAVAGHDWDRLHPGLRVTISLGVSPAAGRVDPVALVAEADARLYDAKRNGRNRVEPVPA